MKGSSIAEQNNSSVLSFIDDLTQSRSVEDLVTLLLKRQHMKEKKSNEKLLKDSLILKQEIASAKEDWRKEAATNLCYPSFESFTSTVSNCNNYICTQNDDGYHVKRIGSDAPPRIFKNPEDRCPCYIRVAFLVQCTHEVTLLKFVNKPLFDKSRFHIRHHFRQTIRDGPILRNLNEMTIPDNQFSVDNDDRDEDDDMQPPTQEESIPVSTSFTPAERPISFTDLKSAAIEVANEVILLNNKELSKMYMGLLSHLLDTLKDPQVSKPNFTFEAVGSYVDAFTNACIASNTRAANYSKKRKKSYSEKHSIAVSRVIKEKSCTVCGALYSVGHHTCRTCPEASK
jgi:ribosomal protein L40E